MQGTEESCLIHGQPIVERYIYGKVEPFCLLCKEQELRAEFLKGFPNYDAMSPRDKVIADTKVSVKVTEALFGPEAAARERRDLKAYDEKRFVRMTAQVDAICGRLQLGWQVKDEAIRLMERAQSKASLMASLRERNTRNTWTFKLDEEWLFSGACVYAATLLDRESVGLDDVVDAIKGNYAREEARLSKALMSYVKKIVEMEGIKLLPFAPSKYIPVLMAKLKMHVEKTTLIPPIRDEPKRVRDYHAGLRKVKARIELIEEVAGVESNKDPNRNRLRTFELLAEAAAKWWTREGRTETESRLKEKTIEMVKAWSKAAKDDNGIVKVLSSLAEEKFLGARGLETVSEQRNIAAAVIWAELGSPDPWTFAFGEFEHSRPITERQFCAILGLNRSAVMAADKRLADARFAWHKRYWPEIIRFIRWDLKNGP